VLDVRGISTITDYYVIASGTSSPHLKALVTEVQHRLKGLGVPARRSGLPESGWVVVDGLDAVIHIFAPEARAYYAIESLWKAAPEVPASPEPG
jgi:ribosome-associated protein